MPAGVVWHGASNAIQPGGVETRNASGRSRAENSTTTRVARHGRRVERLMRVYRTSCVRREGAANLEPRVAARRRRRSSDSGLSRTRRRTGRQGQRQAGRHQKPRNHGLQPISSLSRQRRRCHGLRDATSEAADARTQKRPAGKSPRRAFCRSRCGRARPRSGCRRPPAAGPEGTRRKTRTSTSRPCRRRGRQGRPRHPPASPPECRTRALPWSGGARRSTRRSGAPCARPWSGR